MNRTYTRKQLSAKRLTEKEAMKLNAEMKEDCMQYIIPRVNGVENPNGDDVRFAQKIFRNLLKQGLLFQ